MPETIEDIRVTPVILCGGGGTRLWPRSRKEHPKPFLQLLGTKTLFQQTAERCANRELFDPPLIVAGEMHVPAIEEQLGLLNDGDVIIEPAARNTAPAIALAAARLEPDAIMLVCPSDHFIADQNAFERAVIDAAMLAEDDWLVSLAIQPDRPETGYGYVKRGRAIEGGHRVEKFVEKPSLETAITFLSDGGYSWNGGIFAFRAGALLDELSIHRPDMARLIREANDAGEVAERLFRPASDPFMAIVGESIDYAVMENTSRAAMVPAAMGWSDIGNWASLHAVSNCDENGNTTHGQAELVDCENVLVSSDGPRVSALGLKDVCIIIDGNEVLVTTSEAAPHVGKLNGAQQK